jgi:hypothetical protein
MNKDTKVLLMAVVIILVALVSFNMSDLTGKIIKNSENAQLIISPTLVTFGKHDTARMITIQVSPGKNGINQKLWLYRGDGRNTQADSTTVNICTSSICYDDVTVSYRVDAGLKDGKYYFKAERENTGQKFVSNEFEVKHI